jgi:hypothetical protein
LILADRIARVADGFQPILPFVKAQPLNICLGERFCRRGRNEPVDLMGRE